ncbi:MAG: DUF3795 domain-containing protein [Desulfobacteraceae bacterium]|nr:DUF3795 domain-containing protein [Desulfobacteraceae bacterium]
MKKKIGFCGLVCSSCPAFLATHNDDDDARKKTAELYSGKFGLVFKPEDINCDGCTMEEGRLLGYCQSCEIRKCCQEKGLENCAVCDEQLCAKLREFHNFSPDARACFDTLVKNSIKK